MTRESINRILQGKQRITFEFIGRFVSTFGVASYAEVFAPEQVFVGADLEDAA